MPSTSWCAIRCCSKGSARRLGSIGDLERFASRITLGSATPRELLGLGSSLEAVDELAEASAGTKGPLLGALRGRLDALPAVRQRIVSTIEPEPPSLARDGGAIRSGVDPELDALREIARDSKSILLRIEAEERQKTGVGSLKIRFNSVFGYYIEISKANLAKVPPHYIRKQTLVNAERFITPELKELEEKIVGAEEKSLAIELRVYEELLGAAAGRDGAAACDGARGRGARRDRGRWPRSRDAAGGSARSSARSRRSRSRTAAIP